MDPRSNDRWVAREMIAKTAETRGFGWRAPFSGCEREHEDNTVQIVRRNVKHEVTNLQRDFNGPLGLVGAVQWI